MIKISINNEVQQISTKQNLAATLAALGYGEDKKIAVAVNQCFVAKTQFEQTWLAEGDEVEVVQAINGG